MNRRKSNALKRPRHSKQPGLVSCMGRPVSMCRYIKTRTYAPKVDENASLLVLNVDRHDEHWANIGSITIYKNKYISIWTNYTPSIIVTYDITNVVITNTTLMYTNLSIIGQRFRYTFDALNKCISQGEIEALPIGSDNWGPDSFIYESC